MKYCCYREMHLSTFFRYAVRRCCKLYKRSGWFAKFQTGFPYTPQTIVIIRLCQAMLPAPGIHFHIGETILAIPDLISLLLKSDLLCN